MNPASHFFLTIKLSAAALFSLIMLRQQCQSTSSVSKLCCMKSILTLWFQFMLQALVPPAVKHEFGLFFGGKMLWRAIVLFTYLLSFLLNCLLSALEEPCDCLWLRLLPADLTLQHEDESGGEREGHESHNEMSVRQLLSQSLKK